MAPKDRKRDYEDKLADYAATNVAEYWIVDPERRTVTVHRLDGERYTVQGESRLGQTAISALLPRFAIDVAALFAVEDHVAD